MRAIAKLLVQAHDGKGKLRPYQLKDHAEQEQKGRALFDSGYVPKIKIHKGFSPKLVFRGLTRHVGDAPVGVLQQSQDVPQEHLLGFWLAVARGAVRAIYRERSFSDYVMPYLVASITILVGVLRVAEYVRLNAEMLDALSSLP